MMNKRFPILFAAITGALFFGYLQLTNAFYAPVVLRIQGNALPGSDALEVQWDLGRGLNSYEKENLKISPDSAGHYEGEVRLPRGNFKLIRVKPVGPSGSRIELTSAMLQADSVTYHVQIEEPTKRRRVDFNSSQYDFRRFSAGLLFLHLCMALTLMWCIYLFLTEVFATPAKEGTGLLRKVFVEKQRWIFWVMFGTASAVFSLWLLAFWPGFLTNDSFSTLAEVAALDIHDWHPYVYTFSLLVLTQLGQTIAVVPLCQILATSAVGSLILTHCVRRGVSPLIVGIFFLLFVSSIPIGTFNLQVWKDVPFSICVLIISFLLYLVQREKMLFGRPVEIPRKLLPLLALVVVGACQLRHNGVIFYVLLPLLLLGRLQRRDFMIFVIFLVSTYGIVNRFIPAALEMVKTRGSPYHQLKTSLTVMTHYNYFSEDRKRDIAIIENATGLSWEKINELFPARWFSLWDASLIQKKQFGSDQGNTEEYNGAFVRRLISENLPIVMGNRLYEFLHSAGVDASTSDARNGFYENPLQLSGSALHPPGLYRFGIAVESKPKSDTLHDWLGRYATTSFAGLLSSQVIIWNTVVFLGLFLAVIFFEGGLSAIGLFTLPSLVSAFAIGMVGAGESWRYLYYVYLTGIFVIPLYISYRKDKMVAESGCPRQQGAR